MNTSLLHLKRPELSDMAMFTKAMQASQDLHHPWVTAPQDEDSYQSYCQRFNKDSQASYLLLGEDKQLVGVFHLSEIVRGCFQNAYLSYFVVSTFAGQGLMSAGLKLLLKEAFEIQLLHRLEANVQPENLSSVNLIKANGFRLEGFSPKYLYIDGEWRDHQRYAITREEWPS